MASYGTEHAKELAMAGSLFESEVDTACYKDYILSLLFYKRPSNVYEVQTNAFIAIDHTLIRVYLPFNARWEKVGEDHYRIQLIAPK
jgi:hypothetical protein